MLSKVKYLVASLMLLLILFGADGASTLTWSVRDGVWSSSNTWQGGYIPAGTNNIDHTRITNNVIIDMDLGNNLDTAGMGKIEVDATNATVSVDNSARRTIIFNWSGTGTNAIGTGSTTQPNITNSDYHGFVISRGTLNLNGTASNPITITATGGTGFWYYTHIFGLRGWLGATPTLNMSYCVCTNLGRIVPTQTGYGGGWWDFTMTASTTNGPVSYDHCEFYSPTYVLRVNANEPDQVGVPERVTLNSCLLENGRTNYYVYVFHSSNPARNYTFTNNTFLASTFTNQPSKTFFTGELTNLVAVGNVSFDTGSKWRSWMFNIAGAGSGGGGNYYFAENLYMQTNKLSNQGGILQMGNEGYSLATRNIAHGATDGLNYQNSGADPNRLCESSYNWISQQDDVALSQGSIFQGSGHFYDHHNVLPLYSAANSIVLFSYRTDNSTIMDNNSGYGPWPAGTTSFFTYNGEGATGCTNNNLRGNIGVGFARCYTADFRVNANISFSNNVPPNAGVHHNGTWANQTNYHKYGDGTGVLINFDDGTNAHPNFAVYGDIDANPQWVDPNRTVKTYVQQYLGAGASEYDLIPYFAARTGLRGAITNELSNVELIRQYLFQGFQPRNNIYRAADHLGNDMGAVSVQPVADHFIGGGF